MTRDFLICDHHQGLGETGKEVVNGALVKIPRQNHPANEY